MTLCPCGSRQEFSDCCGPIIDGTPAKTAEALMRSRYSAIVLGNFDHVAATHAPEAAEDYDKDEAKAQSGSVKWTHLDIRAATGGEGDEKGSVEFVAKFKQEGKDYVHHELASFRRVDGNWMYVDGILDPKTAPVKVQKIGRNDPCSCGSGKKYKKCCGA